MLYAKARVLESSLAVRLFLVWIWSSFQVRIRRNTILLYRSLW